MLRLPRLWLRLNSFFKLELVTCGVFVSGFKGS
jgi:hypothetical protein